MKEVDEPVANDADVERGHYDFDRRLGQSTGGMQM